VIKEVAPLGQTFGLKATLYITTSRDSGKDSIGCRVIPFRTAAVDGVVIPRHTVLFIKETVGLRLPDGRRHDGYWYATDVGSAIHPGRIDLYTGKGLSSIWRLIHLNLKTLTVSRVGRFTGCPDRGGVRMVSEPPPASGKADQAPQLAVVQKVASIDTPVTADGAAD
jgi:3D (Asp-Asp-Asp) domain-containing protein